MRLRANVLPCPIIYKTLGEGELRVSEDDEGKRGGAGRLGGYAVSAGASTFTGRESCAWHVRGAREASPRLGT